MRCTRHLARWAAALTLSATGLALLASPAQAHPTDETVQQAYLTPTASGLSVQLDLTPGVLVAPAFARAVDTNGDRQLSADEKTAQVELVASALRLRVNGRTVPLTVTGSAHPAYELLAAAGGTVTVELAAVLPEGSRDVVFTDEYAPPGRTTVQMDVLVADADPATLGGITHADGGREITLALEQAGTPTGRPTPARSAPTSVETSNGTTMLRALRTPLASPWALLALISTCALLGALHALTPGHGKALLASYLVGARSTPRQAVSLGAVITVTHTAAVVAIGVVALAAGHYVVPGVLVPALEVVSGIAVLIVGVRLLIRRWRQRHNPHHHHHHHGHHHTHNDHALADHDTPAAGAPGRTLVATVVEHRHETPVMPTTFRGIATMGVSGGIIPCPEALSVLLLAVALHRPVLGLAMVVAFSIGLAAVLVGLGLVLVSARSALDRFRHPGISPLVARLPLVSAAVVTALALTMTANGLTALTG
ncbi:HoxN/HupN/NixA family nickel/cobalt transporter [Streptomyces sp. NPDC002623]